MCPCACMRGSLSGASGNMLLSICVCMCLCGIADGEQLRGGNPDM